MFDVGLGEIVLILIVALMVVGPGNLPKAARSLGRMMAWVKFQLMTIQREINMEIRQIEMKELEKKSGPNVPPPTPPVEASTGAVPRTDEPYEQPEQAANPDAAAAPEAPARVLHDLPPGLGSPTKPPPDESSPSEEPKP
jgi:Tat protein translocase TatB subunit